MKALWFGKQNIFLLLLLSSCGLGGGGDGESVAPVVELKGAIKSASGSQSELNQWSLVLVDYDTGSSISTNIGGNGTYTLSQVKTASRYSIVLLDPQFKLSAVLSAAGDEPKTVKQVFRLTGPQLPTLVHNGPVINFTDATGINWEKIKANDVDGDLIPDGREAALAGETDTDADGIVNTIDADIDGDGVLNWFDSDDDADSITDAFDSDANADGRPDIAQSVGDNFFKQDLQYISVQVIQDILAGGALQTNLLFTAKIHPAGTPSALKIKGPSSLFENVQSVHTNAESGAQELSSWDYTIADEGADEDGGAKDGTYSRRVQLANGKLPRGHQLVFFQYLESAGLLREYPFMFSNIVTGSLSGAYNAAARSITLSGSPFDTSTNFKWTVHIYESTGKKVFASEPIEGTVTSYIVPADVLEASATYTAKIVASTPDRLPSFPIWVIRSESFNL